MSFHITVSYNQTNVHILSETGNTVRTMLGEYDLPNDTSGTFKASPMIHLALLKQNVATVDQVFLEASGFNQILPHT